MHSTSLRRKVLVLLLLTAMVPVSWASAAKRPTPSPRPASVTLSASQSFFNRIVALLTSAWAKAGCDINPNGLCVTDKVPAPSPEHLEAGCNIDPNGRCGS